MIVHRRKSRRPSAGQSMVEFALIAPVLLFIVLFALDLGRVFVGWVSLQNMARVGANFAAQNPNTWDPATKHTYVQLMTANGNGINCGLPTTDATWPDPAYPDGRDVGNPASVSLNCSFNLITPFIASVLGQTVTVSATSSFPISYGCLAECPPPPPEATPPPPPDNCRVVPTLVGLSVDGARNAWVAAGFDGANFAPAGNDTRTVDGQTITEPPGSDPCPTGKKFFLASVTVSLAPVGSPTSPTCIAMPNLKGMTVADARTAWTGAGFTGAFTPATGQDDQIILDQLATPDNPPGTCVEPDTSVAVVYEDPPPPPPPAPCQVPSFVNTSSTAASGSWTGAGFSGTLTFNQPNKLPYTVKSQSLVGGTWVGCGTSITLSNTGRP